MQHEVIVIGGGIGGLTTAALLATRGVNVCLFERQSRVGGCVANFEHLGYSFEPTFGLYSGWESGGTWDRVFAELSAAAPVTSKLSPAYVVRLPDGRDVEVTDNRKTFEGNIAAAFSDCGNAALHFFRTMRELANETSHTSQPVAKLLENTSPDFRLFIDAQLQMFAQCTSTDCPLWRAASALKVMLGSLWSIRGGGQALADRLADILKRRGGLLRLNSPVLRLAYGSDGTPIGVDLLSGERVIATRAIVSNLTIWDTYGKLIGLSRTPQATSAQLRKLSAWGAYLIFMSVDEQVAHELAPRLLTLCGSASSGQDPARHQLMLNLATADPARAPNGKRTLTATAFTDAQDWFSFHEDATAHEQRDQAELEKWWTRLHFALPELGDGVEVIETATPQTFYEATRRKFGMVGMPSPRWQISEHQLPFANVFLVSDTTADSVGLEGVAQQAIHVTDSITRRR